MLVSVVIPLFNEEEGSEALAADLAIVRMGIERLGHRSEIVFVDDGSTDGTSWQISLLYRARSDVRVVAHKRNLGFGAALRSGIAESRGAVVLVLDGDRPYPPEDAAPLVEAVQGPEDADVATVSPWASGGKCEGVSALRRMLSRSVSRLYRMALRGRGQGITCFTSSFRAYKADVLRSVEFEADDFLANAEILVRVLLAEHRVIEMASRLHVRKTGASKMRIFRTIGRHLGLLRRLLADGLDVSWKAGPEDTEPDTALK